MKNILIAVLILVVISQACIIALHDDHSMRYSLTTYLSNARQLQIALQMFCQDAKNAGELPKDYRITRSLIDNNYLTKKDLQQITSGRGAYFITIPASSPDPAKVSVEFFGDKGTVYFDGDHGGIGKKAEQGAAANP